MNEEVQFVLDATKEGMDAAMSHLEREFLKIRAGKASPAMLSSVLVWFANSIIPSSQR